MLSWEFPPRIVGGIARHVDELSRALAEGGVAVDVLTAYHPGAPATEEIPAGAGRVRVLRAGPSPINPLDFSSDIHQLNFALLERLLREGEVSYDLVHAHDWLVAFTARTLKHGRGWPLVSTLHATEAGRQGGLHTPLQHYIHSIEWLLTYEAWRVIVCTQAMRREVAESLRTPPDKLRVIPNGLRPERMQVSDPPAALRTFRRRWAEPEERIVLFVGRMVPEKGVQVLLAAAPALLAAHPRTRFVIAGGGERAHLEAQARAAGISGRVTFTGFLPEADLPRLYAVADVAAFPSLYEPFGIVALEAMAAGVPVVTSDAGGFREVVRHLQTGLHTWAGNPDSLAWGVNLVLSDAALAARLRAAGRAEVAARFTWDRLARQTQAVYEEVLTERDRPRTDTHHLEGPTLHPRYLTGEAPASRS
jgi:glycosyltransferase involved in cell wall biosynthesis